MEILRYLAEAAELPRVGVRDEDAFAMTKRLSREEKRLSYDGHWSRAMHEVSAEALQQAIDAHGLR